MFAEKGGLGAISTYVYQYPATKWDYERLMVDFQRGRKILADGQC
jgi:hypothetical protein